MKNFILPIVMIAVIFGIMSIFTGCGSGDNVNSNKQNGQNEQEDDLDKKINYYPLIKQVFEEFDAKDFDGDHNGMVSGTQTTYNIEECDITDDEEPDYSVCEWEIGEWEEVITYTNYSNLGNVVINGTFKEDMYEGNGHWNDNIEIKLTITKDGINYEFYCLLDLYYEDKDDRYYWYGPATIDNRDVTDIFFEFWGK
jgi:hypothetical protein